MLYVKINFTGADMLILRKPGDSQPPQVAEVDRANNLASKACAIALPITGGVRVYAPQGGKYREFNSPLGSGISVTAGTGGIGIGSSAQNSDAFKLYSADNAMDTIWEAPSAAATVLVVAQRFGAAADTACVFGNESTSSSPYVAWGISDRTGSGQAAFEFAPGGAYNILAVTGWLDANVNVYVGRYNGSAIAAWKNGVKHTSETACSGTLTYPNSVSRGPSLAGFWTTTTNRAFVGRVYLSALWPVALSEAEIASISRDPWQLFEPRRIIVSAYQPADSILVPPYLSNPGVSNITTTGAQPVVRVEY